MECVSVPLQLDPLTVSALRQIAAAEDVTVGQVVRDAIRRDLRRREKAKRDDRTDERLVAPLRSLLADDLAFSRGWPELQARLMNKGYALREAGGGLILVRHPGGNRVCKASDLGYSHARLARRLGSPFPAHRQAAIVARQIGG